MNIEDKIAGLPIDLFSVDITNKVETISGKGMLYLNTNGLIELKVFPHTPKDNSIENLINDLNESNKNVGKIIPEDTYYVMKATSINNDQYYCKRVLLRDHDNYRVYIGQLCADLTIHNDPDFDDFKIGRIEIPYKIKLPFNRAIETEKKYSDKWTSRTVSREVFEIDFEDKTIDIFSEGNNTVILIQAKGQKLVGTDIPFVILTLELLTCSLINRYAIEYESKGTFKRIFQYYYEQKDEILKGYPPLNISISIQQDSYIELFSKFHQFVSNNDHTQIERTLHRIISSRNSFITTYALTLTTAIEKILRVYYSRKKVKLKKSEIQTIVSEIENTSICDNIKNRLKGMIWNILGQERADDILYELLNNNKIEKKQFDSWKTLRNSVSHGDDPSDDLGIYIKYCNENLTLYYKLIFLLIDYKGYYTDYSTEGYPLIKM